MRLNPDCIRDILLTVEEEASPESDVVFPDNYDRLEEYSQEEVIYHLRQCNSSGLFEKWEIDLGGNYYISDLSPKGHELIAQIREKTVWENIKSVLIEKGISISISAISRIAPTVLDQLGKGLTEKLP